MYNKSPLDTKRAFVVYCVSEGQLPAATGNGQVNFIKNLKIAVSAFIRERLFSCYFVDKIDNRNNK